MFIGALYSRFGKTVLLPVYFTWMALCLLGPRMFHSEAESSLLGQTAWSIRGVILGVSPEAWLIVGGAAVIAMGISTVTMGRKQMVR